MPSIPTSGPTALPRGATPPALLVQFALRYWWIIRGYDVGYLDVFISLERTPGKVTASDIIDRALRKAGWLELNLGETYPTEFGPLFREEQGRLWGYEVQIQEPPIPGPSGKELIRKYRIRNASGPYPHLSPVTEIWVDREDLL